MAFRRVYEVLSQLRPFDVMQVPKVRVGAVNDGGYVMLDRFSPRQVVFTYGLSWNVMFEHQFAEAGHQLYMFDHTIDSLTVDHSRFMWSKEGIAGTAVPSESLYELDQHIQRFAPHSENMILKLDVEGAEWDVLAKTPREVLARFDQIVIEFHDLHLLSDTTFSAKVLAALKNLNSEFTLHHVHGNNHAPVVVLDGLPIAAVIEGSYVRTSTITRDSFTGFLPSFLDAPNDPTRPDVPLWFYPFHPLGSLGGQVSMEAAIGQAASQVEWVRGK